MAEDSRRYTDDVPEAVRVELRELCLALPDAYEEAAWKGTRWMVRKRTFAHVIGVEVNGAASMVVLAFRSSGDELLALRNAGPPFLDLGWGRDAIGLLIDDTTDWEEVGELLTESFCVMAPKKLVLRVDRPPDDAGA